LVYILQSQSSGRFDRGQTDNLNRRIRQHNDPFYTGATSTNRFAGPWRLGWSKELSSRSEAMVLEKKIKKCDAQRFLENSPVLRFSAGLFFGDGCIRGSKRVPTFRKPASSFSRRPGQRLPEIRDM
jgi:putative endonuclease